MKLPLLLSPAERAIGWALVLGGLACLVAILGCR